MNLSKITLYILSVLLLLSNSCSYVQEESGNRNEILLEMFAKIEEGMTKGEVRSIMVEPDDIQKTDYELMENTKECWWWYVNPNTQSGGSFLICFNDEGNVIYKSTYSDGAFERRI